MPARLAHHFSSDHEWLSAHLRRHQPDQASGKRFLERAAVKGLLLGGVQEHHPAREVDGPVARTVGVLAIAERHRPRMPCFHVAACNQPV